MSDFVLLADLFPAAIGLQDDDSGVDFYQLDNWCSTPIALSDASSAFFYDRMRNVPGGALTEYEYYQGSAKGTLNATISVVPINDQQIEVRVELEASSMVNGTNDQSTQSLNQGMTGVYEANNTTMSATGPTEQPDGSWSTFLEFLSQQPKCSAGSGKAIIWGEVGGVPQTRPGQMLLLTWSYDLTGVVPRADVEVTQLEWGWNYQTAGTTYNGPSWGAPYSGAGVPTPAPNSIDYIIDANNQI